MIKLEIIGNLTRDPETRITRNERGEDRTVCSFTVAANPRGGQNEAIFVRVSVWNRLAENCQKYLAKGRKVFCAGTPAIHVWASREGNEPRGQLELTASEVDFLTPKGEAEQAAAFTQETGQPASDTNGFVEVETEELPF